MKHHLEIDTLNSFYTFAEIPLDYTAIFVLPPYSYNPHNNSRWRSLVSSTTCERQRRTCQTKGTRITCHERVKNTIPSGGFV